MLEAIKNWFASKGGFSHVVAAVFAGAMLAYAAVPEFHALVLQINAALPGWAEELGTTIIALIVWYKNNQSAYPRPTPGPVVPPTPQSLKSLILLACLLGFALSASAQSGVTFTGTTEVTALRYNGAWGAANHTTESFDLIDWGATKGNSLSVEGHELAASSAGFNSYLGGVKITPDISSVLSKTNLAASQFGVFAQAAAGEATLPTTSAFTFFVGGGANYRMTANLSWSTVDFRIGRVGSLPYYEVSSGIQYIFNPTAAKSLSVRSFLAKRAAKAALDKTIQ